MTSHRLLGRIGGVVPQCHTASSLPDRRAIDEPQMYEFRTVVGFGVGGTGGETNLSPPPSHHGELETWEDWSWQLKR